MESSSSSNKWRKLIKKQNPEFYARIKDIMAKVPDLRPETSTKHMKQEYWDPWRRLYDELSALGIDNNDAARDLEALQLLIGEKSYKELNWKELIGDTIRGFVITYPVITYLVKQIADPIDLEMMWAALGKFNKLKNPKSKLSKLHVFVEEKNVDNLFALYPKDWAWTAYRTRTSKSSKTTYFGLLPASTLMHLTCGGKSYHVGDGFRDDDLIITDINIYPDYWFEEDEEIFSVDLAKLKNVAQNTTMPHREVICRQKMFKSYYKRGYPEKEWYNEQIDEDNKKYSLLPINSRPWVLIEKRYEVVRIDSAIKNKALTIEDIFFACRALCPEPYSTYDEFNIVEDKKGVLVLEVSFDG